MTKLLELTAAAGSELQAVLQAIHNLELGAHRIAANDASGSAPHHSEPQAIEAKATGNLPSTSVTVDTVAASGRRVLTRPAAIRLGMGHIVTTLLV